MPPRSPRRNSIRYASTRAQNPSSPIWTFSPTVSSIPLEPSSNLRICVSMPNDSGILLAIAMHEYIFHEKFSLFNFS